MKFLHIYLLLWKSQGKDGRVSFVVERRLLKQNQNKRNRVARELIVATPVTRSGIFQNTAFENKELTVELVLLTRPFFF